MEAVRHYPEMSANPIVLSSTGGVRWPVEHASHWSLVVVDARRPLGAWSVGQVRCMRHSSPPRLSAGLSARAGGNMGAGLSVSAG